MFDTPGNFRKRKPSGGLSAAFLTFSQRVSGLGVCSFSVDTAGRCDGWPSVVALSGVHLFLSAFQLSPPPVNLPVPDTTAG